MTLRSFRDVPGPRGIAAHWDLFHRRYHYGEALREISDRYGDVARLPFVGNRTILLSHPDDIQAVIASKTQYFRIFGQDMLRRLTYWGILATEGQIHDDNRGRLMLAMRKVLARRVPEIAARACRRQLAGVRSGDIIDLDQVARDVALDVAASLLYPPDFDDAESRIGHGEFGRLVSRSSAWLLGFPPAIQWAAFMADLPRTVRAVRLQRRMRRQVGETIARARTSGPGGPKGDLLSLLVDGSEIGGPIAEEFLADNILTMLLAGYETSRNVLAWALWEAARDESLQTRLAAEAATLPDDPFAHEAWMNDAHWTDATLRESLRLYPSVWTLSRRAISDYRIGDFVFGAGTSFLTSQWVTHRDPRWFPDPLRFDPGRWEREREAQAAAASPGREAGPKRPSFAYFPFGGGNRFCIGKATFELEGTMLLAAFFRDWIAEPLPHCDPRPEFFATMRPAGPMRVRVRRR